MGLAAVKWGILSTAYINRKVIPGVHASKKAELIAVASRDQRRAEEYAREWEIGRAYLECPEFSGREDFLAALSAGTVTGRLAGHSIHLYTRYDKVRKWLGRRGTKRS